MTIIQNTFDLAIQHHQSGRLLEAEALYRQILAVEPRHPDVLNLLGLVAHQRGRHDLAVELIRQSTALNPGNPDAHNNLGEACRALGQLDVAIGHYRRALEIKTDCLEAQYNLGIALAAQSRFDEAIAAYQRAIGIRPDYSPAYLNWGNVLCARGEFEEAVAAYQCALRLKPDYSEGYNNLGNALCKLGRFDEAAVACEQALAVKPNYPEACNNLGNAHMADGKVEEAIAAYRRALKCEPAFLEAHINLGAALTELGRFDEAIAVCRRATEMKPNHAQACNNLGNALVRKGQCDEAVAQYRRALEIEPDYAQAHNNLGVALARQEQLDEAIYHYRRALEIKRDYPEACNNLGNALSDEGQLDEAIAAYRRAVEIRPEYVEAHSNLIYSLHFRPGDNTETITREQQHWNRRFSDPVKCFFRPHTNDRDLDRRLRIGYVSPDFRAHVIGRNLLPLFQHHDRRGFEIICYSSVVAPDGVTQQFRERANEWHPIAGLADESLAETIRRDRIDILVDLTQHMVGNRLSAFTWKPAPVQVSFAGYPECTGVEAIEWRISDRYLSGENTKRRNEKGEQVCMIDSFWCYDPAEVEVGINESPAKENNRITFGSLNNFCKINEPTLRLWARVLREVADSRLVLLSAEGSPRRRTCEVIAGEGVDSQRVEFVNRRSHKEYLESYHRLDIVLDPFPYTGHTTSLDALWMGVPVVSLAGATSVSRAGLSILSNLGLPELVAQSEDEYVGIATQLARDLPRLGEMRSTLRAQMEASVLMDAPRFARSIETAYRAMWRRWCAENAGA